METGLDELKMPNLFENETVITPFHHLLSPSL